MELAKKDSQRIKHGKCGRKKCTFTFLTRFMITRLFRKRGSPLEFRYDLAKATKTRKVENIVKIFDLDLKLQASI